MSFFRQQRANPNHNRRTIRADKVPSVAELERKYPKTDTPVPSRPAREISETEAVLLHMEMKDMRRRHPRISSALFKKIRSRAYAKTETKGQRKRRRKTGINPFPKDMTPKA